MSALVEERRVNVGQLGPCRHCGWVPLRLSWQTFSNGKRHLRGECHRCGGFVAYIKQTIEAVAEVDGLDRDPVHQDIGTLFADYRNFLVLMRPAGPWSDLRRRMALALDQAGDAVQRGDTTFLRGLYGRTFKYFAKGSQS